jgi:hypothetical protein
MHAGANLKWIYQIGEANQSRSAWRRRGLVLRAKILRNPARRPVTPPGAFPLSRRAQPLLPVIPLYMSTAPLLR